MSKEGEGRKKLRKKERKKEGISYTCFFPLKSLEKNNNNDEVEEKMTDIKTSMVTEYFDRQHLVFPDVLKIVLQRGREKHDVQHFVADWSDT